MKNPRSVLALILAIGCVLLFIALPRVAMMQTDGEISDTASLAASAELKSSVTISSTYELPPDVLALIANNFLGHAANYPNPNETVETVQAYLDSLSLLENQNFEQALQIFRELIEHNPESRYAHEGLAYTLLRKYEVTQNVADLRESTDEYIRAEQLGLVYGRTHYAAAISRGLAELQDAETMYSVFKTILESADNPYVAKWRYAQGLAALGDPHAEQTFQDAIQLSTDKVGSATLEYAEWLFDMSRYADILSLLEFKSFIRVSENKSGFSMIEMVTDAEIPYFVHFLRGVALEKLGRTEEAVEAYNKYRASGINTHFAVPSKFRIADSQSQYDIKFEDDPQAAFTEPEMLNRLSKLIMCEAEGESHGGRRAVAWTVRTRVNMAYYVSSYCGAAWGAEPITASLPDKYWAIMGSTGQYALNCSEDGDYATYNIGYNVYIGSQPEDNTQYCPRGTLLGSWTCTVGCSFTAYTGASAKGAAWFWGGQGTCPLPGSLYGGAGPGGGSDCSILIGKTCGNGANDNCFYGLMPPLVQEYWRGNNVGWIRYVPIINGVPLFNNPNGNGPSPWRSPNSIDSLPSGSSGEVQALSSYILGSTFYQELWRGNVRYTRSVPISGGDVQWHGATTWTAGLSNFGNVGSGTVQARNDYVLGNTLYQGFWRGDQGWIRTVTISNGVPQWGQAAWNGPYTYASVNLPGNGSITALSIYIVGSNLRQSVWRNDNGTHQGWSRYIPIVNNVPQWNHPDAQIWTGPILISSLAGDGGMQAQDNYAIP